MRIFPKINPVKGILISTINSEKKKKDLVLIQIDNGSQTVGVFTNSKTPSEPIKWSKRNINNKIRGIFANSGNANALTGKDGEKDIKNYLQPLSKLLDCKPKNILVASTGVIGKRLNLKNIKKSIPKLYKKSKKKCCSWRSFSESIMTTDTFPKAASKKIKIGNKIITISGVAKGSGMIHPNMGTMLAFIFTDAEIPRKILKQTLINGVNDSFNSITVDGDTSTSDTVFLTSTGKTEHKKITSVNNAHYKNFIKAFNDLLLDLAIQIVKDGEGAKKIIKINISNAANKKMAKKIGFSIANSMLVKTFLGSKELNFGRLYMAIGKSMENINPEKISITFGDILIIKNGRIVHNLKEDKIKKYMLKKELFLKINLNSGKNSTNIYTCDLTHKYVTINTNYLT